MFSTKKHLVPDAEVKVQKVKKIEPVYNLVTRPMVYANNQKVVTVEKRPVGAADFLDRVLSDKDIDHYIKTKKQQFQQGGTERASSIMFRNSRNKFSQKHSLG